MFGHIPPIYQKPTAKPANERGVQKTTETRATRNEESLKPAPRKKFFVERRKNQDRRQSDSDSRDIYDVRANRGRRKTDHGHPSINTKA